jgi:glutamate 5-kinase
MVICTSQLPEDIVEILNGARRGTKFHPLANSLKGRKRWLLTGESESVGY